MQRMIEGQHLDTRIFLHGYEVPLEGQRNMIHSYRQEILQNGLSDRDKRVTLRTIDDLWADYLARVAEYRSGVHWVSWSGRDPHREYLLKVDEWYRELEQSLPIEIARRLESADPGLADRGAVWTYLTTDEPFDKWKRSLSRQLPYAFAAYWGMGA
jgi:preprotein translocase subunit SecA